MTVKCLRVWSHWIVQQLAVNAWLELEDTAGDLKISFLFSPEQGGVLVKNPPCATAGIGQRAAVCRRWLVCRSDMAWEIKGKAGHRLCSRDAGMLQAAGPGLCKRNISAHRFRGCCQLWHSSCSKSSPPEPMASRQRESFPWKKMCSEGSQKEIPEQPCQDPHRCRDVDALCSLNQSSSLAIPHALQGKL